MIPACRSRTPQVLSQWKKKFSPAGQGANKTTRHCRIWARNWWPWAKRSLPNSTCRSVFATRIVDARGISKFGALRRQMQYIGRLMREEGDAETIRVRLDAWKGVSVDETARLHLIERWRLKLLKDEKALEELIADYPRADIQQSAHADAQCQTRSRGQQSRPKASANCSRCFAKSSESQATLTQRSRRKGKKGRRTMVCTERFCGIAIQDYSLSLVTDPTIFIARLHFSFDLPSRPLRPLR